MTAEEYAIERLMRLDKDVEVLRTINKRAEDNCDCLSNKLVTYHRKLEQIKQIIILTLEHEPDLSSDIMLYKDDAQELIEILEIKIDKEVSDEVPED